MDSTYVKEMERLANEGRVIEKDGQTYSSLTMNPVFFEPRPEALTVRTLTGLKDYLANNRDGLAMPDLIVQVVDHKTVAVMSALTGKDRRRDSYIAAKFDGSVFSFGSWQDSESFIIAVNSLFLPSVGRDEILSFVSRLKIEDESNITDDGVSQGATIRAGIKGGLVETAKAPSRTVLVPYRTFAEIEQPESEFIFRMRRSDGGGVQLALFEADGGAWKSVAMERLAAWLAKEIPEGVAIIA
jgi:hypothetical protein